MSPCVNCSRKEATSAFPLSGNPKPGSTPPSAPDRYPTAAVTRDSRHRPVILPHTDRHSTEPGRYAWKRTLPTPVDGARVRLAPASGLHSTSAGCRSGGTLERAQCMANHESSRTTGCLNTKEPRGASWNLFHLSEAHKERAEGQPLKFANRVTRVCSTLGNPIFPPSRI